MQKNREHLIASNIPRLAVDFRNCWQQKQNKKRKENFYEEGGDENIPDNESEALSEAEEENVTTITSKVRKTLFWNKMPYW